MEDEAQRLVMADSGALLYTTRCSHPHFPSADCQRKGIALGHPTACEVVMGSRERSLRVSPVGSQVRPTADSVALCDPRTTMRIVMPSNVSRSLQGNEPGRPGYGGLLRFNNEKALLFFLIGL